MDVDVLDDKTVRLTEEGTFGCAHLNIAERDILDLHLRKAVEIDRAFEVSTFDILDYDILEGRRLFAYLRSLCVHACSKFFFGLFSSAFTPVEEVKEQTFIRDVDHVDAVDVDILYDASTTAGGFETQADVRTDIEVIAHLNILDTTRHLRAADKTAMTMINNAVIDYYVLRRDAAVTTRFVLTGLHTDSIVAYVEGATGNHDILTTLYIDSITVLAVPGVADIDIIEDEVLAAHRMQVPGR